MMYYYVSPIIEIIFVCLFAAFCIAMLFLFDAVRTGKHHRKSICVICIAVTIILAVVLYCYIKGLA